MICTKQALEKDSSFKEMETETEIEGGIIKLPVWTKAAFLGVVWAL